MPILAGARAKLGTGNNRPEIQWQYSFSFYPMNISKQIDFKDGSSCELTYDEANGWIRATWLGYIDPREAYAGASRFLEAIQRLHCAYLLNDNSGLRGPWFDSVEWLGTVWAPQAARLGLRCIAHVSQQYDLLHQAAVLEAFSFGHTIELQAFEGVPEAEAWLRAQQHRDQSRPAAQGVAG